MAPAFTITAVATPGIPFPAAQLPLSASPVAVVSPSFNIAVVVVTPVIVVTVAIWPTPIGLVKKLLDSSLVVVVISDLGQRGWRIRYGQTRTHITRGQQAVVPWGIGDS